MSEIGNRIRRSRVRLGLTQQDISSDGVSVPYISRIETGDIDPSSDVIMAIGQKMGVSALFLATGDNQERCPYCDRG